MFDAGMIQTLIVGHLWQSVALAAVLAGALILGRRMRGTTRYDLAAVALVASIALPLAAFIPGESLARSLLDRINAPAPAVEQPVKTGPSFIEKSLADTGTPMWAVNCGTQAIKAATQDGAVPLSETAFGKEAIAEGAPKWALDMGSRALQAAIEPAVVAASPPPKPLFTLPQIKLPEFSLPDMTLPLAMIWIAGALILLVRTFRDLIAVEQLVARARPADLPEKLKVRMKGVRVAVSADAPGPMAAGLFRPCIVLPENIALGSPGMAALLEHERAHIERRDMVVALLQRVTLALLWWSPALYWISRRIDEEREVACDEAAVERTGNAKALARSLTIEAENQLWARAPRLAVGAIGPRSQAGRRIKRLIEAAKGAPYAKYSGRLAFAGLALAVAVAAMVTPRFDADAQQPGALPPVEETLDGRPVDLLSPQDRAAGPNARAWADLRDLKDTDDEDLALLGEDFALLMDDLGKELEASLGGLSPELEAELQGLSAEMSALGIEISSIVSQEVLSEMPAIMEEVRLALEAEGFDTDDFEQWSEHSQEVREALQEAREELREALGPEMREEIRAAMEEARAEVAAHREEIKAALAESRVGMDVARQAMAEARAEIAAAKARGDFDRHRNIDIDFDFDRDFDFDFDRDVDLDGASSPGEKLYTAARRCNDEEVKRLITEEKANVNAVIRGDGTPLIAAVRRGCEDAVRVLLNAGADPNLASRGDGNPLMAAAERGNVDMARLLIDRGANVNGYSPGDGNPLIAAAQRGRVDMAKLLIDRGANVNGYVEHDETPLINAAEQGRLDVAKLLVERGAKVNLAYTVKRYNGGKELRSPLNMALRHDHDDVASYLRSKGAVAEPKPAN